ncbi:MAG: hypothetical protein ABJF11_03195 [Reichenbachiella sp.]|uniref:hypothetical protein n=1 Tax=Reichenbachiella sp. TaxID=2184521 RepID=UPI003265CBE5
MKNKYSEFIIQWQEGAEVWALLFLFISFSIFLFYVIGLLIGRNRTKVYEYVSTHEIPAFLNVMIFASISLALYLNSILIGQYKTVNNFELVVQSAGSLIVGVMFWYITRVIIRIYYPYILAKHLAKIRFKKMYAPWNGNKMKLLNEDEEDLHLTEEQIAHEEIFAYDYDVWIDEETGKKKIEKYDIHHTSLMCDECRFRTLHEIKEEVIKKPTRTNTGQLLKHYRCDNCGNKESIEKQIAPLSEE